MIKLPSYFSGFRSKADGSAGLSFNTQELTAEDFAEFKRMHGAFGWLVFSPQDTVPDLPKERIEDDSKSPSERLYAVMYVYWKQNVNEGDFDVWRKRHMEKIIEQYKSKLKDL